MPKRIPSSPGSVFSVPDSEPESEASDFAPSPPESKSGATLKRKRPTSSKLSVRAKAVSKPKAVGTGDIEDLPGPSVSRPHSKGYHDIDEVARLQGDLLTWFEGVRDKRGMPWRKRYEHGFSMEEKGQRAYEGPMAAQSLTAVSEVMLQQTQVVTVIAYWQRWIAQWPTIAHLAQADIEAVNSAWKGLGYYRRARSLLAGAKTVMGKGKYQGRLPDDPAVLEKEIDGVGRYTAGAICSMAYGVRTPIVDGNIHRLLTRLLAIHATQTSPQTIKALWAAAEELVQRLPEGAGNEGIAGDWNQALMELGSQICKPVSPTCSACPLRSGCKAYAETNALPPQPIPSEAECALCEPIPTTEETASIPSVMVFPMRKEKKVSRAEEEVVCVVEWRGTPRRWLFVKRPEKGLLAGLFEPLTTPIPSSTTESRRLEISAKSLASMLGISTDQLQPCTQSHTETGSMPHIFSHINMTYHIQHLVLDSAITAKTINRDNNDEHNEPPTLHNDRATWLTDTEVEGANIGTGVKKVWKEVFGSWGVFERKASGKMALKAKGIGKKGSKTKAGAGVAMAIDDEAAGGESGGKARKVVKKVMMPLMPRKVDVV